VISEGLCDSEDSASPSQEYRKTVILNCNNICNIVFAVFY